MDEFITFCRKCDPSFPEKLAGASLQEIERVQELVGITLPPEYQAFLARMGRTPPDSLEQFFSDVSSFGIEAIREFYLDPPVAIQPETVYLWTIDSVTEMFLSTTERPGQRTRPVLLCAGLDDRHIVADSLLQYLYREAFLRLMVPRLSHRAELRQKTEQGKPDPNYWQRRHAEYRAVAGRLGFDQVPYLDGALLCFERPCAALRFGLEEVAVDIVNIYADDEREMARLRELLLDNLDLESWGN